MRILLVLCAQNIIRAYRKAGQLAVQKLQELSVDIGTNDKAKQRDMMVKCAMTSMSSKLVSLQGGGPGSKERELP